jgi:hypothetical protein
LSMLCCAIERDIRSSIETYISVRVSITWTVGGAHLSSMSDSLSWLERGKGTFHLPCGKYHGRIISVKPLVRLKLVR